jgi:hypothetical protein
MKCIRASDWISADGAPTLWVDEQESESSHGNPEARA